MDRSMWRLSLAFAFLLLPLTLFGQTDPDPDQENRLPFEFYPEDPNLPAGFPTNQELLGLNSFGAGKLVPGQHSDVPRPPIGSINPEELLPPDLTIPRYYIYCYYYGCRPWFIHPYTGAQLAARDIIASVHSENPDFPSRDPQTGRVVDIAKLLEVDPELGEAPVVVEDMGLVDENNEAAIADFAAQTVAETENAAAVGVTLGPQPMAIHHAPYYGLYCLRVRICIPIRNLELHRDANNQVLRWRYWCKFRFPRTQPVCWSRTWWYRWFGSSGLRPWQPWCLPHVYWSRSGPDWVCHVHSVNRFRHWCLFGFRYYFPRITDFDTIDLGSPLPLPYLSQLNTALQPPVQWFRPWPYPVVRYWPYRPYGTRWYWFRCYPWYWYRHFPPVIQFAVATANAEHGAGFVSGVPDTDPNGEALFPLDPPNLADGEPRTAGAAFDSFFDIDVECRGRALAVPALDENGDGNSNNLDTAALGLRQTSALGDSQDADNNVEPEEDPTPAPPPTSRRTRSRRQARFN